MNISGKTKVCGVIGDPIEHTLSPIIHNAAFSTLQLDYVFLAFRVKRDEIENAVNGLRSLNMHGLNVTMPHKSAVTRFLDRIDAFAQIVNSVNTIINKENKLFGFNTDGVGALKALRENGVDPKGKKVLLLGAGGTARAIAYTIAKEADELAILNRTLKPAQDLCKLLEQKINKKIIAGSLSPKEMQQNLKDSDILINATSIGIEPKVDESLVNPRMLRSNLSVMDVIYNPTETKLVRDAMALGAKVVSGIEMLIYQGAASFEIWTGKTAPIEVMRQAALKHLHKV